MNSDDAIVVVGIGGQFPGAENIEDFWTLLENGENHVLDIPKERWNVDNFYDSDPSVPGKTYVRKAGLVKRYKDWDHTLFGITEMEAEWVDPQQRMVLDCTHMALENGGIRRKDINDSNTGVYIGVMNDDFKMRNIGQGNSTYTATGTNISIISARVSYVYNLHGPAMTVDTACSSSLVAIHLGSQALRTGEIDMAICGGVNSILDPGLFVTLTKSRMLSPSGQCHTFTTDADGYARGEGCGIVILKRLKDALNDGNTVLCTLMTGINQDGRTVVPITAPSGKQQTALLNHVYSKPPNGFDRDSVQVIEAHGTGTSIGDPTEANALGNFFARSHRSSSHKPLFIGSVKTNIGHLESAAGVAGLIKVLLMMQKGKIVPSLHYSEEKRNPKIDFDDLGLQVPTKCFDWCLSDGEARVACVNSFGFGGTNAHAIIQQYIPTTETRTHKDNPFHPFLPIVLSTTTSTALKSNVQHLYEVLESKQCKLAELSFTTTCKRDHFVHRTGFVAETQESLLADCKKYIRSENPPVKQTPTNHVIFVFCGVGTAWQGMGKMLLRHPVFHNAVYEIDNLLKGYTHWSIAQYMEEEKDIGDSLFCQLAIFTYQVGLAEMWKASGIRPDAIVGQSVGEVAAAYISGALDLENAVRVIYLRSELLLEAKGGKMMVIGNYPIEEVDRLCTSLNQSVCVAVRNSPVSCTVSGDTDAVLHLKEVISEQEDGKGALFKILEVDIAFHSHHVDQAKKKLLTKLNDLQGNKTKVLTFSTVTGQAAQTGDFITSEYWGRNLRQPVMFGTAVKNSAIPAARNIFIEIGPGPVLRTHLAKIAINLDAVSLSSARRKNEGNVFLQSLIELYKFGLNPIWEAVTPTVGCTTTIPMYQFQRKHGLFEGRNQLLDSPNTNIRMNQHMCIERCPDKPEDHTFKAVISTKSTKYLFDHIVHGSAVLPGAFYVDVGLEVGRALICEQTNLKVYVEFLQLLPLKTSEVLELDITATLEKTHTGNTHALFEVRNGSRMTAKGSVSYENSPLRRDLNIASLKQHLVEKISADAMYVDLEKMGFQYGEAFRVIKECFSNGEECLVEMDLPLSIQGGIDKTNIHPAVLDGMLQSGLNVVSMEVRQIVEASGASMFPSGIGEVRVMGKPEKNMILYMKRMKTTVASSAVSSHFNACLLGKHGRPIAEIRNYVIFGRITTSETPDELKYVLKWKPRQELPYEKDLTTYKNIFICCESDCYRKMSRLFNDNNSAVIPPLTVIKDEKEMSSTLLQFAKQKWGASTATNIIFVSATEENVTSESTDFDVYASCRNNALLLMSLIKCISQWDSQPPLYVLTENTVCIAEDEPVSIVGSELWGFIRCYMRESINSKVTLIDARPSIEDTKETITKILSKRKESLQKLEPELVVAGKTIYVSEFVRTRKCEQKPALRTVSGQQMTKSLRSADSLSVSCPLFTASETSRVGIQKYPDQVLVTLSEISLHNNALFPATETALKEKPDLWVDEAGHSIVAIEGRGVGNIPMIISKRGIFRCNDKKVFPRDRSGEQPVDLIFCYPVVVDSVVAIPIQCLLHSEEFPTYVPGLLSALVIALNLSEHVKKDEKVLLVNDETDVSTQLVINVLHLLKSKHVSILHSARVGDDQRTRDLMASHDVSIVLFQVVDKSVPSFRQILSGSKRVIYLKTLHTDRVSRAMILEGCTTVYGIEPAVIFSPANLCRSLPKIKKIMLKLDNKTVSKLQNDENGRQNGVIQLPLPVISTKQQQVSIKTKVPKQYLFNKSSCYIIVGGLTGLGWELLKCFVQMGAGLVATLSRRNVSENRRLEQNALEERCSCNIINLTADVTKFESLQAAFRCLEEQWPMYPIRGIFQGAGIVDSSLVIHMTKTKMESVLIPKILGTWNLHLLSLNLELDYFVIHSSITSVFGSPGQANYGAANSFLDSLALFRRKKGLPAQAVNWGALDVGMAAEEKVAKELEKRGHFRLKKDNIQECMIQTLLEDSSGVIYAQLDWKQVSLDHSNPGLERLSLRLKSLLTANQTKNVGDKNSSKLLPKIEFHFLKTASDDVKFTAFHRVVVDSLERLCGIPSTDIRLTSTMQEIGMDSLTFINFTNVLYDLTKCRLEMAMAMSEEGTVENIIKYLVENVNFNNLSNQSLAETESTVDKKHQENVDGRQRRDTSNGQKLNGMTNGLLLEHVQHGRAITPNGTLSTQGALDTKL